MYDKSGRVAILGRDKEMSLDVIHVDNARILWFPNRHKSAGFRENEIRFLEGEWDGRDATLALGAVPTADIILHNVVTLLEY